MTATFSKKCIRTEAPVTEEVIERLADLDVIHILDRMSRTISDNDILVDGLKKLVFYNKGTAHDIKTAASERRSHVLYNLSDEGMQRIRDPKAIRLLHVVLGLLSEGAELLEPLMKYYVLGTPIDWVNVQEELGDNQWYIGLGCDVIGKEVEDLHHMVIAKLSKRYPDKFTEQDAVTRDLDSERKVLESQSFATSNAQTGRTSCATPHGLSGRNVSTTPPGSGPMGIGACGGDPNVMQTEMGRGIVESRNAALVIESPSVESKIVIPIQEGQPLFMENIINPRFLYTVDAKSGVALIFDILMTELGWREWQPSPGNCVWPSNLEKELKLRMQQKRVVRFNASECAYALTRVEE